MTLERLHSHSLKNKMFLQSTKISFYLIVQRTFTERKIKEYKLMQDFHSAADHVLVSLLLMLNEEFLF